VTGGQRNSSEHTTDSEPAFDVKKNATEAANNAQEKLKTLREFDRRLVTGFGQAPADSDFGGVNQ
jgi:hypothetical protein